MRKLIFGITAVSGSLVAGDTFAACYWQGPEPSPSVKTITLPAEIAVTAAPIGAELAKYTVSLWPDGPLRNCGGVASQVSISLESALLPSSEDKVYETGVKGIGVKFCVRTSSSSQSIDCLPYSEHVPAGYGPYAPQNINVIFVRTGRDVASGDMFLKFKSVWKHVGYILTVESEGTVKLVNDVFFAGCESVGAAVNVPMGKQTIQSIKNGSVKEVPFNFDVRCDGLKPDTKVPVKVYFEGTSQADGMLKLSNLGQSGVASGVGISLVNDKGVKLPFDIARSVALDWNRDAADGSIYRFSGKAKYAPTGDEMKPGKGDATMSFVINYN
ncbi:fimbrial protein [Pseudomonas chlororaphis]|uniref:fimbrial protein n=1 Tax=Pseudomonas chlororaphis TaxID=587753 RepID=UPI0004974A79|nr:fimbrial protein [Pseudomonas chlororaphis]